MKPTVQQIDTRAAALYAHLEKQGIPLDIGALRQLKASYRVALDNELEALEGLTGFWPNPNAADDYERIARANGKHLPRTKSGKPRTDEFITEPLGREMPAIAMMVTARSLRRKVSILSGLEKRSNRGRVFPTYVLDPELGRAHAGGDANPMNWEPEVQRLVREEGKRIVVADYERMELKVLATLSEDEQLQADLDGDPYREAAKGIFNTPSPTSEQRNQAKIATLATVYGQSDRGLASQLHVSVQQAQQIQGRWAERYREATGYLKHLVNRGRAEGKATSYHGRTKIIPIDRTQDARDRLAVNSPIQNTAGDLARIGFCNLFEDERREQLGVSPLTTVHDSIVLAVSQETDLGQVKSLVQECLVEKNDPAFRLGVQIKVGENWADAV